MKIKEKPKYDLHFLGQFSKHLNKLTYPNHKQQEYSCIDQSNTNSS